MTATAILEPLDLAKIAQAYDAEPWWYDVRGFLILTFSYRSTLGEQIRLFAHNLKREHLEVAIGSGTLFGMVLRRAKRLGHDPQRVVGIDYAASMLAGAIRRFSGDTRCELALGDVGHMGFPAAHFDSVNVANAMHCFPDLASALSEIHRVLRPGGSLATNVLLHPRGIWPFRQISERINRWGTRKGILNRPYTIHEVIDAMTATGFRVEHSWVTGNVLNLIANKPNTAHAP